jgi:membrane protease YdiL (CAAX protease family)
VNALRPTLTRARQPGWQARLELILYAVTLVAVEAGLIAPGHLLAGDIANAVLILLLVNVGPDPASCDTAGEAAAVRAMRALAIVALIRVVGLGLPLHDGSDALATLTVAVLVGGAAVWVAPGLGVPRAGLVAPRFSIFDFRLATAGLGLGLLAYLLGASSLWSAGAGGAKVLVALIAAIAAAVVEEWVFRGLVQVTMQRAAGRVGFAAASALFAAMYLGIGSAALVLTFALAGVIFADSAARTGSLAGALTGHVVLVMAAGALWPIVLGWHHRVSLHDFQTSVVLAIAIAVCAALALRRPLGGEGGDLPAA